jgi:hypothetical protein
MKAQEGGIASVKVGLIHPSVEVPWTIHFIVARQ